MMYECAICVRITMQFFTKKRIKENERFIKRRQTRTLTLQQYTVIPSITA